jgi:ligand-binding SRPBCC domain-containing protein
VQELARGDHISHQMTGMVVSTQEWCYTPESGQTRLTAQVEYGMPGGALGEILAKTLCNDQ